MASSSPVATTAKVAAAIAAVDRAKFLPEKFRFTDRTDMPVPVSEGITVPSRLMTALMLELLEPQPDDRVLEIGTGSGYQTAVLSKLVAEVVTCDIRTIPSRVIDMLPDNVYIYDDHDGRFGVPSEGHFEKIFVSCGATQVEYAWQRQLLEGGILVVPIGGPSGQWVTKYVKKNGELKDFGPYACGQFVPITRCAG